MLRTGIIKYNVNERKRQFRGVDRDFDTVALAALINSGAVQEQVKNRDLFGYFGHWPRVKFGLNPIEGAISSGKVINLEPALATVYLKAYPNGDIEHEAEFLDNGAGRIAARMFRNKKGGFSSAIDSRKAGNKIFPTGFFGFDYVLEPNYNTNRGYVLDSVDADDLAVLDEVQEYQTNISALSAMFDSLQHDFELQQLTVQDMAAENEELRSMIIQLTGKQEIVMDNAMTRPDLIGGGENRFIMADDFLNAELPEMEREAPAEEEKPVAKMAKSVSNFFNRRFI